MGIVSRVKRLVELSKEPQIIDVPRETSELPTEEKDEEQINTVFIPRIKRDPVDEIVNEQT